MKHDDIVDLLSQVTYRPGWTITAHRHPFGTYVLIDAEVLDSEKWDDSIPVEINYRLGNTTRVGVRACVPPQHGTPDEFYDWLEWRLSKVEHHEMREFFKVDGKPWDSPHKRAQPKHDYHVRNLTPLAPPQTGSWWGVYRHDELADDGLGDLLQLYPTMQEAYKQAIFEVVQDDLRKGMVGPNG